MKTYIKPEIETSTELVPDQLLAVSGMKLFEGEGDNPFDAAPPFLRPGW